MPSAGSLTERLRGSNVQVVQADATRLPLQSGRFSAATSFAMLHHVPSRLLQDRLLAELCRVLRSGGLLVGSEPSTPANSMSSTVVTLTCPATRTTCRPGSGPPASSTLGSSSAS